MGLEIVALTNPELISNTSSPIPTRAEGNPDSKPQPPAGGPPNQEPTKPQRTHTNPTPPVAGALLVTGNSYQLE